MTASLLAPGVYCTMPLSSAESGHEEHWARLKDAATLASVKASVHYGNCLALSGGGYRATIFHLGVLRRVNDVGMLGHLDTISSVSGGSLIAAALAHAIQIEPSWWPSPGDSIPDDLWESRFAAPFRAQARRDIRSRAVMAGGFPFVGLTSGVEALEREIAREINPGRLRDLPHRPRFLFCCTEMERGDYWLFGRDHIGPHNGPYKFVLPDYPIARAVAASTCFPPVMDPQVTNFWALLNQLPPTDPSQGEPPSIQLMASTSVSPELDGSSALHHIPNSDVPEAVRRYLTSVHLTDGGVFDNNAIEATWPHASHILVSDAGGPLQVSWQGRLLWRLQRYQAITSNVARSSQTRWLAQLQAHAELASIYVSTKAYGFNYPKDESASINARYPETIRRTIAHIRSDLDAFTEGEICILENHGYCEAAQALRQMADATIAPRWTEEARVPWRSWMDPERAARELQLSHRTIIHGHHGWKAFIRDRVGAKSKVT